MRLVYLGLKSWRLSTLAALCLICFGCASGGSGTECGDGVCESGETEVSCPQDCHTATCGDGMADGTEMCDGYDLGGKSCVSLGYDEGVLACSSTCTLDTSGCHTSSGCGDGVVQAGEACDGADLNGQTCSSLGYAGGVLMCHSDCTLDTSSCESPPSCGNGVVDAGEDCDGADLGGSTCLSLGFGGGSLSCGGACSFDTSGCEPASDCGNGVIDTGEDCDGGNLGGASCQGLGFVGGVLACGPSCLYDTSGCQEAVCGNGVVESGEECDGTNLNGMDCGSLGQGGGTLACDGSCYFDTSGCVSQSCPLDESFEGGVVPPAGWERIQTNPSYTWKLESYDPADGLYYANVEFDPNLMTQDEVLISTPVICSNMTIQFWAIGSYTWSVLEGNYDVALWAVVGAWGGGDDVLITSTVLGDLGSFTDWEWYFVSYPIPSTLDNQEIRLAWEYYGSDGAEFALDGVHLSY